MKNHLRSVLAVLIVICTMRAAAQTPIMSSYPNATAVLYLNFDGAYVAGTSWNYNGPLTLAPSGLTSDQITEIFNRVSEDYRPFNVNVTTDSVVFSKAPVKQRMQVIVTITNGWYPGVGGISFVGSFTWGNDTPCFVFSAALGYNTKYISEATAHELGHSLGLYHQAAYNTGCVKVSDYNSGTGSGQIGWAPIMGVGYYQNFTLWNNGPDPYGCTQNQSDLSIITSQNGFSYRADDYGNTFKQAYSTTFTNSQFTLNGIIEQNTDVDMFQVTIPSPVRFYLEATPYGVGANNTGSNLDMQLTLYDKLQKQLNIYNPPTLLNAIIDTVLNPGTYYVKVEGKGNIYAPNYASLGSYSLKASIGGGVVLPLRALELSGKTNGNANNLSWAIVADEKVVAQSLEYSTDGKNFMTLVNEAADTRSYSYTPDETRTIYYRLNVTFDNGNQYYSNVVSIGRKGAGPQPKLIANLIPDNNITVNSPSGWQYEIVDINGRRITYGLLAAGTNKLSIPYLTRGMYIIHFTNGQDQLSEKFVRQ
jgi:hypothetical protein